MRILWLKTELLHPVDKGGRIRTYAMLRELKKRHHITYLTLDDGTGAADALPRAHEYCHDVVVVPFTPARKRTAGFYVDLVRNLASPLPYFLDRYRSEPMRRAIAERFVRARFDLVVSDFLVPAVNLPRQVPAATLLFQHNVEAMIWRRHFEVQRNPLKKAYFYEQWRRARRAEGAACRRFDAVVAVSVEDAELLRQEYGLTRVAAVPTGVDTQYFRPSLRVQPEPRHLVFTGSMDWLPNVDAMTFFIREVLPLVRRRVPDVRLTIVGRDPDPRLSALVREQPRVSLTGGVPDVRPYVERAAAFVMPIRVGSGTRIKAYEAMAMEKPVISTSVGCEGLPVEGGQHLLIADAPADLADAVVRVLTDATLAHRLGRAAAALVRSQFGWDRAASAFEAVCRRAVGDDSDGEVPERLAPPSVDTPTELRRAMW